MTVTIGNPQLQRCVREFWRVAAVRPVSDHRTREGDMAFWAEMVRQFPTVQTGDLDPLMCFETERMQRAAIAEWDSEGVAPETNTALDAVMTRAANQWLYCNHPANQEGN